jgi:Rhodanese-like domain
MKRSLFFVLAGVAVLVAAPQRVTADPSKYPRFAQQSPPANVALISVDELVKEVTTGKKPMIIDVRSQEEYREVHILGALSAPLPEFNAYLPSIPRDRLVILY